jgi:pimeloyl-ACP methyl ester carboxylesterase
MSLPGAKFVDTPAVKIQFHEVGSPDGIPVILLHGFPDAPHAYAEMLEQMEDLQKTHRFLLPYLRGFGETRVLAPDLVAGQTAALGDDLLRFADALGIARFHLVGHDWGASASYAAAVLEPARLVTMMTLASPYVMYGGEPAPTAQVRAHWYQWFYQLAEAEPMMEQHAEDFCRQLWESWSPAWGFSRREFTQAAAAWKNPQFAEIVLHYYRMKWGGALGRRAYAAAQATLQPKPKIAVPSLYVQGTEDACDIPAGFEGQEAWFSGTYESLLVKGAGHFPHREQPKAVAKILRRQLGG